MPPSSPINSSCSSAKGVLLASTVQLLVARFRRNIMTITRSRSGIICLRELHQRSLQGHPLALWFQGWRIRLPRPVYRRLLQWKHEFLSQRHLLPHSSEQMRPCCCIHGKIFDNVVSELAQAVVERTVVSSRLFAIGQKVVDAIDYQLNLYGWQALRSCVVLAILGSRRLRLLPPKADASTV